MRTTETGRGPIVAEGLGRRYRRRRSWALRELSLAIPAGSITALVGPNGAGKSTFLRLCVGFEPPDEGTVAVDGHDLRRDRTRAVESAGYVPQANSLYHRLRIRDHITMAIAARPGFDAALATVSLGSVGLTTDRRTGELSGGERAKVSLALAIACRPPVLLLDEPLASLDPLARRQFLAMLGAHVREHATTVLLSSHIVTDVEQACDRIVVLLGGRMVLHAEIAAALRTYRVTSAEDVGRHDTIGTFSAPDGRRFVLHTDQAIGRPATLEEVTLGFLASRTDGSRNA